MTGRSVVSPTTGSALCTPRDGAVVCRDSFSAEGCVANLQKCIADLWRGDRYETPEEIARKLWEQGWNLVGWHVRGCTFAQTPFSAWWLGILHTTAYSTADNIHGIQRDTGRHRFMQIPFSKWWALALVVAVGIFVYCTVVGGAGWLIYATYLYFSRRKGKLDYVAQADVEFDADDDAVEMTVS
jgi:hypothetical protein